MQGPTSNVVHEAWGRLITIHVHALKQCRQLNYRKLKYNRIRIQRLFFTKMQKNYESTIIIPHNKDERVYQPRGNSVLQCIWWIEVKSVRSQTKARWSWIVLSCRALNDGCLAGSEVTDVCEASSRVVQSGHLVTPNYPDVYPANINCLCRLEVDRPAARLKLTFYDLALETKKGRCQADWIMLRQKGKPNITIFIQETRTSWWQRRGTLRDRGVCICMDPKIYRFTLLIKKIHIENS